MTASAAICCPEADVVDFHPVEMRVRTSGGIHLTTLVAGLVCLGCGFFERAIDSVPFWLIGAELEESRLRWQSRRFARAAVAAERPVTVEEAARDFPNALWLSSMGLLAQYTVGATIDHRSDQEQMREDLRALFGSNFDELPVRVPSVIGDLIVDAVYYKHIFDVDAEKGRSNVDADHVSCAPMILKHLLQPLEVWEQQLGGIRTRKHLILACSRVDNAFMYQRIVVLRDRRILTAHRLSGGLKTFEKSRFGIPRWAAY